MSSTPYSLHRLADALQKFLRMDDHAAGALQQRLDDHGGDFRVFFFEQLRELADAVDVAGGARFADGTAVAIRAVHAMHGEKKTAKRIAERGARADGHGADGVSMIGVLESDDRNFPRATNILPILNGDFESDFHGGGAIVGKENAVEFARHNFAEAGGELFDAIVGEAREQDVIDFRGLLGDGGHDGGMAMPMQIDPPR